MFLTCVLLAAVATPQPDVVRVRTLLDEVDRSVARADTNEDEDLQNAYVTALGGTLQEMLPDLFGGNVPRENVAELKDLLRKHVRARMKDLPAAGTSTPARREALRALARQVTSRTTGIQLVSTWLGLPAAPGPRGKAQPMLDVAEASRKVLSALQLKKEEASQPAPGGARLEQLRTSPPPSLDIAVDPAQTWLLEDVGGPGEGNQLVDGGEWIHLRIGFKNRSERPWFSTSALFDADGACLALPTEAPVLLPELQPGATGALETWLYVSKRCGTEGRKFQLRLRDTHRGEPGGAVEVLSLEANEPAWPALASPRLDGDAWGHSDGKELPRISPDTRIEFSTGLSAPGQRLQAVKTRIALPQDLAGLFNSPAMLSEVALVEEKPGQFSPSDDLDLEVVPRRKFDDVLGAAGGSKKWVGTAQGGTLWLAVDSEVEVARATAPAAPDTAVTPPAPAAEPPSADAVAKLARQHVTLVARRKSPSLPNGVDAAEGYEATFDAAAFMDQYRALLGTPVRTEAAPAAAGPAATPTGPAPLYVFRNFHALPLAAATVAAPPPPPPPAPRPRAEPPPPPPVVAAPPPPAPAPVPPSEVKAAPFVVADVAVGVGLLPSGPTDARPSMWNTATTVAMPQLSAGVMVGRQWAGMAGVRAGLINFTAVDAQQTSVFDLAGHLAGGHQFALAPAFRLTPWLGLDVGYRDHGLIGWHTWFAAGVGVTGRLEVADHVGILLEGAWMPVGVAGAGFDPILGATGPRFSAGLSFF